MFLALDVAGRGRAMPPSCEAVRKDGWRFHLRQTPTGFARGSRKDSRVTFVELFFDFVFAITLRGVAPSGLLVVVAIRETLSLRSCKTHRGAVHAR
jgi:hypothetical protein